MPSASSPTTASTLSSPNSANVVVADAKLEGVWKNAPIFANDLAALSWK